MTARSSRVRSPRRVRPPRRVLALWLPWWPVERLYQGGKGEKLDPAAPLVLSASSRGAERIVSVNPAAAGAGMVPDMALADARALLPDLGVRPATPRADAAALVRLADWLGRYSPWTVPDGDDGVRLDVSGCAHLYGGEAALLADLRGALAGFGFTVQAAIADSLGAAWALARYGGEAVSVVPETETAVLLNPLPVAALRLPAAAAADLARLGIGSIGELAALPRASLTPRFGPGLASRLDQALGHQDEPLSPNQPKRAFWARQAFPEPIGHGEHIAGAARHLVEELCDGLEEAGRGARRLELKLFLSDGGVLKIALGLARPARDAGHILKLLHERLPTLEGGQGADLMTLTASLSEPLAAGQSVFAGIAAPTGGNDGRGDPLEHPDLGRLIDRLGNRLGPANVARLAPHASHLPERAWRVVAPLAPPGDEHWPEELDRPLYLLPAPEWVEVVAQVPDGPPVLFRWRGQAHKVARADGPERIAPEWWRAGTAALAPLARRTRDYYRIEDPDGRRFWLYRDGLYDAPAMEEAAEEETEEAKPPRWYLHGLFP